MQALNGVHLKCAQCFTAGCSTFGVTGHKWRYAARAACTTTISSFGGGMISLAMSYIQSPSGKVDVLASINGVLGSLVGITASCAVVSVWEALFIGLVGGFLANATEPLLTYWLRIDDAVGATCVHAFGGLWGMLAVGIFARKETLEPYCRFDGLIHGKAFSLILVLLKDPFAATKYIF